MKELNHSEKIKYTKMIKPYGHKYCSMCHMSKQLQYFTKAGRGCKSCVSEYHKQYRKANKEKYQKYHKEYHKKWYTNNKEEKQEQNRQWMEANKEKFQDYLKEDYHQRPEVKEKKRLARALRRSKSEVPLTPREKRWIESIYKRASIMTRLFGEPYEVDHIFPIATGGKRIPINLQVLPRRENRRKKDNI